MSNAEELKDKGLKLYQEYEYEQAIKVFEEAKQAYADAGQHDMAAEMMSNIGVVHRALGQGQQALEALREALNTFQKGDDPLRTAQALGNIGGVYAKMGDREQAYNTYRQAADIFEEIGDKEKYGQTLLAMGRLQLDEGKFMAGAATYQVALENVENPTWQQKMIKNLGGTVNRMFGMDAGSSDSSKDSVDKDEASS